MDKSAIKKTGVYVRTDQTGVHIKTSTGMNIMSNMTGGSDLYRKTNKTLRHMREMKNVTQVRTDERGIYCTLGQASSWKYNAEGGGN